MVKTVMEVEEPVLKGADKIADKAVDDAIEAEKSGEDGGRRVLGVPLRFLGFRRPRQSKPKK